MGGLIVKSLVVTVDTNKYLFDDDAGSACFVSIPHREPVFTTESPVVEVGIVRDFAGRNLNVGVQLTQDAVRALLPSLTQFAETGIATGGIQ